ncbi:MAG: hypothetical protein QOF51_3093, partial [Chloroflexota bacterium]|nr:hypothetical protein [Chloroflexota bacterium]
MPRRARRTLKLWQLVSLLVLAIAALPVAPPSESPTGNPLAAAPVLAQGNSMVTSQAGTLQVQFAGMGQGVVCTGDFGLYSPATQSIFYMSYATDPSTQYQLGFYPAGTSLVFYYTPTAGGGGCAGSTELSSDAGAAYVFVYGTDYWQVDFASMNGIDPANGIYAYYVLVQIIPPPTPTPTSTPTATFTPPPAGGAAMTYGAITFDDLANAPCDVTGSTPLSTRYQSLGVTFSGSTANNGG